MRCYRAKWEEKEKDLIFRLYVAKGVQIAANSFAGVEMTDFGELIGLKDHDDRSGEEIAAEVIKNAGLKVAIDGFI